MSVWLDSFSAKAALQALSSVGPVVGGWLLLCGLAVLVLARRSVRSSFWFGTVGGSATLAMVFLLRGTPETLWWLAALAGTFLLLWVALTPLLLHFRDGFLTGLFSVVGAWWLWEAARGVVIGVKTFGWKPTTMVEVWVAFGVWLFLVVAMLWLWWGRALWFRLLVTLSAGAGLLVAGVCGLMKEPVITWKQAPFLLFGVVVVGFLWATLLHSKEAEESDVSDSNERGEGKGGAGAPNDLLERYRPVAGRAATHLFLILFTIVTIYPVLWVVKMAMTPSQGFSMGLNPVPQPLVKYLSALRRGEHKVASCYGRAMGQNFREVIGVGSVCHDQGLSMVSPSSRCSCPRIPRDLQGVRQSRLRPQGHAKGPHPGLERGKPRPCTRRGRAKPSEKASQRGQAPPQRAETARLSLLASADELDFCGVFDDIVGCVFGVYSGVCVQSIPLSWPPFGADELLGIADVSWDADDDSPLHSGGKAWASQPTSRPDLGVFDDVDSVLCVDAQGVFRHDPQRTRRSGLDRWRFTHHDLLEDYASVGETCDCGDRVVLVYDGLERIHPRCHLHERRNLLHAARDVAAFCGRV